MNGGAFWGELCTGVVNGTESQKKGSTRTSEGEKGKSLIGDSDKLTPIHMSLFHLEHALFIVSVIIILVSLYLVYKESVVTCTIKDKNLSHILLHIIVVVEVTVF